MRTTCMACDTVCDSDEMYINHMQTVHGTNSPDQAMKKEKFMKQNLPKDLPQDLPPGIPPEALPTPEFMEIVQQIDSQPVTTPPPPTPTSPPKPVESPKPEPIELTYKYEGKHDCGNGVKTIMIDAGGKIYANAFCLICNKTVDQAEVSPLPKKEVLSFMTLPINEKMEIVKKAARESSKKQKEVMNVKPSANGNVNQVAV